MEWQGEGGQRGETGRQAHTHTHTHTHTQAHKHTSTNGKDGRDEALRHGQEGSAGAHLKEEPSNVDTGAGWGRRQWLFSSGPHHHSPERHCVCADCVFGCKGAPQSPENGAGVCQHGQVPHCRLAARQAPVGPQELQPGLQASREVRRQRRYLQDTADRTPSTRSISPYDAPLPVSPLPGKAHQMFPLAPR